MSLASVADNFLIGARSAWLSPSRGFAVFAGVFLATVVLIAVLGYGAALGQVAMQDAIKNVPYDALIHFKNEPGYKPETRTDNLKDFSNICNDFIEQSEFMDCGLIFARQGFYLDVYPSEDPFEPDALARAVSQDIRVEGITGSSQESESGADFSQPTINEFSNQPDIRMMFLSLEATNGSLGDIYADKVMDGEWFSGQFEETEFQAVVPQELASMGDLSVGDLINISYSFASTAHEKGQIQDCVPMLGTNKTYIGEASYWELERDFCRQIVDIRNVNVIGIYKPYGETWRDNGLRGRILLTAASLDQAQTNALMGTDHAFLALNIDRSLMPSNTVGNAQTWLNSLEERMEGTPSSPVTYDGIEINYEDRIINFLSDINIFVILVQIVDYVLMVPVIVLSLAVLVYGLNLALEQRRAEIAIHRVYGGTARALRGLILSEIFIISGVAWGLGYILGLVFAHFIANAVGFMEFEKSEYAMSARTTLMPTIFVFVVTVGLAMVIAWFKTRRFLAMEIEEGIKKEVKTNKSKLFLVVNILLFLVGMSAIVISFTNPKLSLATVLLYVFGPFSLWIGGAIIMARLSGYGPRLTVLLLGKTRLLSDVRIGIRGSELNSTMNQLGLIVVLTISIVTMAVFQGYTGSLVDERSASAAVGADVHIELSRPMSELEMNEFLDSAIAKIDVRDNLLTVNTTSIRLVSGIVVKERRSTVSAAILSPNHLEVLHWDDQWLQKGLSVFSQLPNRGFTSGVDVAETLDLAIQAEGGINDILSPFDNVNAEDNIGKGFSSLDLVYPFSANLQDVEQEGITVDYLGGHKWIPGMSQDRSSKVILLADSTFPALNGSEDYRSSDWFVEFCDEKTNECSDALQELSSQIALDSSVLSVQDWATAYGEVKRNGGLIFGTPGILSLQYIVAAFATLASSLVFLSLVLTRRRRELAILQSIGASVAQLSRLVIFEITSVFTLSLVLGGLLGLGLAQTFTGLFSLLGALFQLFLGSEVIVTRELVWPWLQILTVNALVFLLVFAALLLTTLRAVRSDLPTVLKEE